MKSFIIILTIQAMSCFVAEKGFSAGTTGVRAIANEIAVTLQKDPPPSFARGRGPVDLNYKLNALLMQLCAMNIAASDVLVITERIQTGPYDSGQRGVSSEVARAVSLIAHDSLTTPEIETFLNSQIPAVRATGCFLSGKNGLKEVAAKLKSIAGTDPYILVTSDQRGAIKFVAPVREKAAEALQRFGEPLVESGVDTSEGFTMLKQLFAQKPDLQPQIESLLESAVRSDFHGKSFQQHLREFVAAHPTSTEPSEKTFLDLCRKLGSRPSRSVKTESEWPTDSEGAPLPAPPTRP